MSDKVFQLPQLNTLWVFAAPGLPDAALQQELTDIGFTIQPLAADIAAQHRIDPTATPTVYWVDLVDTDTLPSDPFCQRLNPESEAILILTDSRDARYERLAADASSNEANRWIDQGDAAVAELHGLKSLLPKGFYSINLATLRAEERPIKLALLTGRPAPKTPMVIAIETFGYRYGIPPHAQWVIDTRFLPNPYYDAMLRPLCGQDEAVQQFIQAQPAYQQFVQPLLAMFTAALPAYYTEGKRYVPIAIGCTGGQHRSVMVAHAVADHLKTALEPLLPSVVITLNHRETAHWPTPKAPNVASASSAQAVLPA